MVSINERHPEAARRFAAIVAADPHEPLDILRMNIAHYQAMLAAPTDGEHRRQIERVLLGYEAALLRLEAVRTPNHQAPAAGTFGRKKRRWR